MEVTKDYGVHVGNKKHTTPHGTEYQYYNVREYENGCIMLGPRELVTPEMVSERILEDMDQAIHNFKMRRVSAPVE